MASQTDSSGGGSNLPLLPNGHLDMGPEAQSMLDDYNRNQASPAPSPTPSSPPTSSSGYGDSAAVVPGTPATAQSSPTPSGSPVPSSSPSPSPSPEDPTQYNGHGYFTPTPEMMDKFDRAVAAGYPLDQLDPRFKASLYLAKGGDPLATYDMARTLILDPARQAYAQSTADGWKALTENPIGLAVDKLGDAANFIGQQAGSLWSAAGDVIKPATLEDLSQITKKGDGLGDTVRSLAAGSARVLDETEKTGLDMWNSLGAMMEFQPGKAAATWGTASQHASNASVLVGQGISKGINDIGQQITSTGLFMGHLASGTIANIPGIRPEIKDAITEQDNRMTYGLMLAQRNMNNWSDHAGDMATNALAKVGLVSQAMTDQLKLSSGQITDTQLEGARTIFNPANWIGPAQATKGIGLVAKPVFQRAVEDSGQAILNLKAEETSALSRINAAQIIKQSYIDGKLGDSGQVIADLREQQAAASSGLAKAQDARTANLPPDGGNHHPQFDADIAIAQSRLDGVRQQLDAATAAHPTSPPPGMPGYRATSPPTAPFTPSKDWQDIPEGMVMPNGGEFKMNMSTGRNQARWDNPPPPVQAAPAPGQGVPFPPMPPEFDNQIAAAQTHLQGVRSDIQKATADHQQIVINAGNALQRNVGVASQAASALTQGAAAVIGKANDLGTAFGKGIENWTLKLAGGDPQAAAAIRHFVPDILGTIGGFMHGGLEGAGGGGFMMEGLQRLPQLNKHLEKFGLSIGKIAYNLSVLGKEFGAGEATSSFANRLGQKLGVPQTIVKAMDFSAMNDVTRFASGGINSAAEAGGLNAALGYFGSGGNLGATGQSLISGSILGFGGGMAKTWRDFNSPESLQSAQVNDRYRFLQSLDSDTAAQFKKLHPDTQLSIGSYASQHPDLDWRFDAKPGSGGSYNVDTTGQRGVIHLDPTQPNSLGPTVAHEFNHFLQSRGMGSEIVSKLLGTPETNTPGLFTRIDPVTEKPVRMPDGSFDVNDEFKGLHEHLRQAYIDQGHPNEPMSYERTAKELAAESAVGWLSPGSVIPRKTIIGHLMNLGVSGSVTKPFLKEAIASFGNGFGNSGDSIHGTGLFTGKDRIPLVDDLMRSWYEGKQKLGPLDSGDSVNINRKDLIGKDDAYIRNVVGPVDGFKTGPNGKILRDAAGAPILRKGKDALQAMSVKAGQQVQQAITEMGDTARQRAGIISDGDRGWTLPPTADIDGLFKGKLPDQMIKHLKIWSGISNVDPGSGVRGNYWAAYKRGRNREPIPDSIPLKAHSSVMPLALTVTKDGNILGHALDGGQISENAQIAVKKGLGSDWNFDAPKIVQAARTMMEAITNGHPAESVVSPGQKRFLYELTGLDPKVNNHNVFQEPGSQRSQSSYKTYRVDRWASLDVDPSHSWKLKSGIYDDLVGYKSGNLQRNIPPRDLPDVRRTPYFSRGATALTTQSAPYAAKRDLVGTTNQFIRDVAEPATPPTPRAQIVQPEVRKAIPLSYVEARRQAISELSPQDQSLTNTILRQGDPRLKEALSLDQRLTSRIRQIQGKTNVRATPEEVNQWKQAQTSQPAIAAGPTQQPARNPSAPVPLDTGNAPVGRIAMAKHIISFEQDDALTHGLKVLPLAPGDRSGPGYEVGGVTPKWDGAMASRLKYLVESGQQKEAMKEASNYIANQTDTVYNFAPQAVMDKNPGAQFMLRDTIYHAGFGAAKRILCRALGYPPSYFTQQLVTEGMKNPKFLENLRQSRQDYLDIVQRPAPNLYHGIANRIAAAHQVATGM
jgi:hypothetical protein